MKQVIATARGYYGALREPGETFMVTDEDYKIGATWFEDPNGKNAPREFNGAFVGSQPTSEEAAASGIAGTPHNPGDVVNNNVADVQVVRPGTDDNGESKSAGNTTLTSGAAATRQAQTQAARAGNPGTSGSNRGGDLT